MSNKNAPKIHLAWQDTPWRQQALIEFTCLPSLPHRNAWPIQSRFTMAFFCSAAQTMATEAMALAPGNTTVRFRASLSSKRQGAAFPSRLIPLPSSIMGVRYWSSGCIRLLCLYWWLLMRLATLLHFASRHKQWPGSHDKAVLQHEGADQPGAQGALPQVRKAYLGDAIIAQGLLVSTESC